MSAQKPLSTDAAIKALKPRAKDYERRVARVSGLQLRVTSKGSKIWSLRLTLDGRPRYRIGTYPAVGLKDARALANEAIRLVASGIDPRDEREAERNALRMGDMFGAKGHEGWYLSEYVQHAGVDGGPKAEKSINTDLCYIRKHLRKRTALMRKRLVDVTPADLERVKHQATRGAWRKVRNILRVVFSHAEDLEVILAARNPVKKTKALPDKKRDRHLSRTERARLTRALREAEARSMRRLGGISKGNARAIWLLVLSGMRKKEVLDLRWNEIDFERSCINLPNSKTGERRVPLTPECVAYLRAERGGAIGGLVCAGENGNRLGNLGRAWSRIRNAADLTDVNLHDLRHSWASTAASARVPPNVIQVVMGHASLITTSRYIHADAEAIESGVALAGRAIAEQHESEPTDDAPIPLRRSGGKR